jgi:MerR family transcriptional regulator, light-induced transcriptional regulator
MDTVTSGASSADYTDAGGYPIGVVATLTGLPVDVIRAWERRYGMPQPARSVGGHRLYSPRDVLLLRRAATLRARGHTAAAACARALAEASAPLLSAPNERTESAVTTDLSARLHEAALALDAGRASTTLAEAAALLDVETLWKHVLAPALSRLGEDWERGIASAAPEHLLSNIVRGRLTMLVEVVPRLPGAPTVVIGAGPGERHDLAPLMLSLLLARAGWKVTFLGAETPADALEEVIRAVRPRVAVISATLPEHAAATLASLRRVHDQPDGQGLVLAYGGPAFAQVVAPAGEEHVLVRLEDDVKAAALQLVALG